MACGCNGRNRSALNRGATGVRVTTAQYDETGMTTLASAPECSEPYTGIYRGATVFIVDQGGEHETLYRRADRAEAITHARSDALSLTQVPASSLCSETMVDLLEA